MKPCSGLIVTSFSKSQQNKNVKNLVPITAAYDSYKIITQNPSGYNGDYSSFTLLFLIL